MGLAKLFEAFGCKSAKSTETREIAAEEAPVKAVESVEAKDDDTQVR